MPMPRRPYVTARTSEIFAAAHELADRLGHEEVTPLHLTACLLDEGMNPAAQVLLYSCQVPREILASELRAALPVTRSPKPARHEPPWTIGDDRVLALAAFESPELGREHIGCEHLLLAFLRDPATAPANILLRYGVDFEGVRKDVLRVYDGTMQWAGPAA